MEHSQIRRVLKLKRISNHQNSFFPNLERSYFYCCNTFRGFGSLSWTDNTCHFEFFHQAGRTVESNRQTTLNHRSTSFLRLDNQSLGFLKERIATSFTVREISFIFRDISWVKAFIVVRIGLRLDKVLRCVQHHHPR